MNEEEKKAVGLLKALNNLEKKCKIEKVPYKSEIKKIRISLLPEDYGIFKILLNLIEKLQKENKELDDDNVKWRANYVIQLAKIDNLEKENEGLKEYIAIAPNLDEMTATKCRNIQQDAYVQGRAEEQQKAEQIIHENYISKQRLKEKIEELREQDKEWTEELSEPDSNFKVINRHLKRIKNQIDVLQELLEGRK